MVNGTDVDVQAIVHRVLEQLRSAAPQVCCGDGVFADVEGAVSAAAIAQKKLLNLGLEKRAELIEGMRAAAVDNAPLFARLAVEETGMGRYEDKLTKNIKSALKTPGLEDIEPTVFSGDHGLTLVERLPFGVAGCITPSTNPTETIINNGIGMVAAGNTVVFSVHPGAQNVSLKAVQLLNKAIVAAGGPQNVLTSFAEPTIQKVNELMNHPQVDLLVATGGPGVVKAVLSSGKKAIGAGPGNPPVIVDETADIPKAARDIVAGASFDNNIPCNGEKEVFVIESVADSLIANMVENGAYLLKDKAAIDKLVKLVTTEEGHVNKDYVGKDATLILAEIGIKDSAETRVIIFETSADHPLVVEEFLMPILPIVRVRDVTEAIELAVCVEGARKHTAVIHSKNVDNMTRFAQAIKTTIFVKNGPSFAGVGVGGEGFITMTIAGPTGEGLTSARSFTRAQRCVLVGGFNLR
ncbi:MAG TPA: aldehyde dehydrogenase EutE [Firmicutes bacterium]|jgi:propionaldehyde dehydrogenase|nr:aldehyde dehydrogenase EutE [Bacillota bacterium]